MPRKLAHLDSRDVIRFALNTDNIAIARDKRDELERADELFWSALVTGESGMSALQRYQAALERASLLSFTYAPAGELGRTASVGELLDRIETIKSEQDVPTTEALLGRVSRPKLKLTEAFDLYVDEIAASELTGKSQSQSASWKKVKQRAVNNFNKVVGDIPLEDISREDARKFYKRWLDRVSPKDQLKGLSASSANRDFGNIRKLFTEYFKYIGEEDRLNPFRNMSFAGSVAVTDKTD